MQQRALFIIAIVAGLIVGVGFGFRPDLLTYPIAFIFTMLFFSNEKNWTTKFSAAIVFFIIFFLLAFPMLSGLLQHGGNLPHVIVEGLMDPFTRALNLQNSPFYSIGYVYNDYYTLNLLNSFAQRVLHYTGPLQYDSVLYENFGLKFLLTYIQKFPADVLVRLYASIYNIFQLSLHEPLGILHQIISPYFTVKPWMDVVINIAAVFVLIVLALYRLRLAVFIVLFVIFFGGYPVLQFSDRHSFYLEFMSLWCVGFLLQKFATAISNYSVPNAMKLVEYIKAKSTVVVLFFIVLSLFGYGLLLGGRSYQSRYLQNMYSAYLEADTTPLVFTKHNLPDGNTSIALQNTTGIQTTSNIYLKIEFNPICTTSTVLLNFKFIEPSKNIDADVMKKFNYSMQVPISKKTIVFFPALRTENGATAEIEVPTSQSSCISRVDQVKDSPVITLMPLLILPDNWRDGKLYQHF